jgi:hypothetical protein
MSVPQTMISSSPLLAPGTFEIKTCATEATPRVATMGSNKGYFQFPLCLLAFGKDYKERLQHIVSYCVCEQARRTNPTFPESTLDSSLDQAASFLHVSIGSYDRTISQWKEADSFVDRWKGRYGKDALVRIGTSLLWEAHNGTGVSYREFSILCAINSIIGKRRTTPRRITEPRIRARAAGFKSWHVAQSELESDKRGKERLLTIDQVRYTLKNLHQRGFFARARVSARRVMYMLGVTNDQLHALLLPRETYRSRFNVERAKKDAELMAAIRAAKQAPNDIGRDRDAVMSVPIEPRHHNGMSPDIVPDINSCSLNNGSCNNSTRNKAPLSLESGNVELLKKRKPKEFDKSQFTTEELAFITLYHTICLSADLGFLPITCRSGELDKVLNTFAVGFDQKEWTKNFEDAVKARRESFRTRAGSYNTLVQICWKLNY